MIVSPKSSNRSVHFMLALPGVVSVLGLVVLPVCLVVWLSLNARSGYSDTSEFVGAANLVELATDSSFWKALGFTLTYTVSTVGLQLLLGLATALALKNWGKGVPIFLSIMIVPYVLPTVLVSVIWRWFTHDSLGILNPALTYIGILSRSVFWFDQSNLFGTLVLVSTWQFFPFVALLCYARLTTIPVRRYEMAAVDGHSPFSAFFFVTLPELKGVILTVVILRGLWMFTKFDTVWLLAGKEALGKYAQTLPVMAYRLTFETGLIGKGAAVATMLIIPLLFVGALYRIITGRMNVHQQG